MSSKPGNINGDYSAVMNHSDERNKRDNREKDEKIKLISLINLQLFAESDEEKTEEATPHKKQQSRKKGQVAKSTDFNAAFGVLVLVVALFWLQGYMGERIRGFLGHILSQELTQVLTQGQVIYLFRMSLLALLEILAPVFVIAMIVGIATNMAQVGFKITPEAMEPKLEKLNPIEGFKRIFSKKALVELAKAMIKIVVVGAAVFFVVRHYFDRMLFMSDMGISGIVEMMAMVLFMTALIAAIIFILVAILDLIYQRWEFRQQIKMTKHELKQEFKQTEGDPLIKAEIRRQQRKMAMSRMMAQVPEATVVVTNPTHLAIALKYDDGLTDAPVVLAKGAGHVALKIIEMAEEKGIPVIENKPAAWSLYETVEIGQEIPFELYQIIAEILAAVYRLKNKRGV